MPARIRLDGERAGKEYIWCNWYIRAERGELPTKGVYRDEERRDDEMRSNEVCLMQAGSQVGDWEIRKERLLLHRPHVQLHSHCTQDVPRLLLQHVLYYVCNASS